MALERAELDGFTWPRRGCGHVPRAGKIPSERDRLKGWAPWARESFWSENMVANTRVQHGFPKFRLSY